MKASAQKAAKEAVEDPIDGAIKEAKARKVEWETAVKLLEILKPYPQEERVRALRTLAAWFDIPISDLRAGLRESAFQERL